MSEREDKREDQDPAPTQHADAERVTGDEQSSAEEIEDDPAYNPEQPELRDVKGG